MEIEEMHGRIEASHCKGIERMFLIGASLESSGLKDLLEDMEEYHWKDMFPAVHQVLDFSTYLDIDDVIPALYDHGKLGLIAEIHIPKCDNFKFDKSGEPLSWNSSYGHCRVEFVYAETLDGLITKIEEVSEKTFREFVQEEKSKLDSSNVEAF